MFSEDNKYDDEHNCYNCRFGYFDGFSSDGWHNLCGAGNCYLCAQNNEYCEEYEFGDVPDGVIKM